MNLSSLFFLIGIDLLLLLDFLQNFSLLRMHRLDLVPLLFEALVELLLLGLLGGDVMLDLTQVVVARLEGALQLRKLLLQALPSPELALGLRALGVEHVLDVGDLGLALDALGLVLLHGLRERDVVLGHLLDLAVQLVAGPQQLVALRDEAVHRVLLVHAQSRALLHQVAQVRDLDLQVMNGLLGPLLLLVRCLNHLPSPLDLLLQVLDRCLVLFGKVEGHLDLRGIANDLSVELAALLDQPLLALVRLLEGPVEFLVLQAKVLQRLVADQLLEDLLEVLLQGLEGAGFEGLRLLLRHAACCQASAPATPPAPPLPKPSLLTLPAPLPLLPKGTATTSLPAPGSADDGWGRPLGAWA
mmetsp:Transcript_162420/g.520530  ORF Transcript_162420/g.520530 Transcript_162420/m.520530 type:complete len:357 (+) Transcript_162420:1712-2782(+)